LQNYKGLDEVQSGLILLPGSLLMGLLMPLGGRLGDKVSPRIMAFIGFSLLGFFFFEYRTLAIETSNWGIIWPTIIRGIGIAMLIAPLTATAMNAVPKNQAGMASSMLNIIQQVGGSIGIAILSVVLQRRSTYHISVVGSELSSSNPTFKDSISLLMTRAHELGYTQSESARVAFSTLGRYVVKATSAIAFQDAFLVGAAMTFFTLILVFFLPNRPVAHKSAEPIHLE
jgi:MFS family permease